MKKIKLFLLAVLILLSTALGNAQEQQVYAAYTIKQKVQATNLNPWLMDISVECMIYGSWSNGNRRWIGGGMSPSLEAKNGKASGTLVFDIKQFVQGSPKEIQCHLIGTEAISFVYVANKIVSPVEYPEEYDKAPEWARALGTSHLRNSYLLNIRN